MLVLPLLRSEEPKIILYNGKIWTADESQPLAQAIAISGGRFLAVGSNDDVLPLATARTRKIDLASKTVLSQVTRTDMKGNVWGPDQRINLSEAIRCGTVNGAYAAFEELIKGSIQPGQLADLVVLAQDPFKTEPSKLVGIQVERTMVGGAWKYES